MLPQLWQRAITASDIDGGGVGADAGGGGGEGAGGETIAVSKEGGGLFMDVDGFCGLNNFDRVSLAVDLCDIKGNGDGVGGGGGGGALFGTTTGSGAGGGGGGCDGGEADCVDSGGAPGGAVGIFVAAFLTSLFADFSAPDAFSTG